MAGFVRTDSAEWTELRVHGVSGTPPEAMLEQSSVRRVAGDAASGFYRRVWQSESVSADDDADVLEAYSWGGLTSGGKLRALWLLLIPFLLVNVAFYARPTDRPGRLQRFGELIQRLFALTITATLVMATVNVSMDFGGWQCGGSCDTAWLGFLSWPWLATPGRRIAVLALLPLAVIFLLWRLAARTWCATEVVPIEEVTAKGQRSPLENRHMWNSARPVRRLRAVHISAALALVGIFALAPFARDWPSLHSGPAVTGAKRGAELLLVLMLLLGLLTLALACLPSMSDRPGSHRNTPASVETPGDDRRSRLIAALPWVVLGVDVVSLLWISLAAPAPAGHPGNPRTSLPWLSMAVHIGILAQAVFLLIMIAVIAAMRARKPAGSTPPAWGGFATAVLMLFGSALSGTYAAAMVLAVAHLLGKPEPRDQGRDPLVTSLPYFWAAALAVLVAVVAVVLAAVGYLILRRSAKTKLLPRVLDTYREDQPDPARAKAISRIWATATLDDTVRKVTGWFVAVTILLIAGAFVGYMFDRNAITDTEFPRALANVGDWLVGLFAAGLLYLGRQTYQNANTRRLVGVIWDLGTFWPRAAHPLAPPCYAERAVPELINRVGYLGARGRVILSCHSQGSIIGAAVVNQLTYEQSERVALLTYGAPLCRLYARFFPAYFGPAVLTRTGAVLLGGAPEPDQAVVPWRNLYRLSDPIGGAVFDDGIIDRLLVDPKFPRPAGDISYPPTFGHSYYPDDPQWPAAVADVKRLRLSRSATPSASPSASAALSAEELGRQDSGLGAALQA